MIWSEKNNFNREQKSDIGASVCMDTALLLYVRSHIWIQKWKDHDLFDLKMPKRRRNNAVESKRRRVKHGRYNTICIVSLPFDDTIQVDHACFGDVCGLYRIVYGYRHICERTVLGGGGLTTSPPLYVAAASHHKQLEEGDRQSFWKVA